MILRAIWAIAKFAYKSLLRGFIKKAIDNPESQVDEIVLEALDRLFEYKE